jgi:hypothetical protein
VHSDSMSSPHEEYITRHVSGKNKDDYGADMRVSCEGRLNFMLQIVVMLSMSSCVCNIPVSKI